MRKSALRREQPAGASDLALGFPRSDANGHPFRYTHERSRRRLGPLQHQARLRSLEFFSLWRRRAEQFRRKRGRDQIAARRNQRQRQGDRVDRGRRFAPSGVPICSATSATNSTRPAKRRRPAASTRYAAWRASSTARPTARAAVARHRRRRPPGRPRGREPVGRALQPQCRRPRRFGRFGWRAPNRRCSSADRSWRDSRWRVSCGAAHATVRPASIPTRARTSPCPPERPIVPSFPS